MNMSAFCFIRGTAFLNQLEPLVTPQEVLLLRGISVVSTLGCFSIIVCYASL
jgi:hypothetical protein